LPLVGATRGGPGFHVHGPHDPRPGATLQRHQLVTQHQQTTPIGFWLATKHLASAPVGNIPATPSSSTLSVSVPVTPHSTAAAAATAFLTVSPSANPVITSTAHTSAAALHATSVSSHAHHLAVRPRVSLIVPQTPRPSLSVPRPSISLGTAMTPTAMAAALGNATRLYPALYIRSRWLNKLGGLNTMSADKEMETLSTPELLIASECAQLMMHKVTHLLFSHAEAGAHAR